MLKRNRLKTITAYNFFGKKCTRSVIGSTSLNGNELVLDLHYAVHSKGKQFVIPEAFDPENKDEFYTINVGDYIVEGICEETKKAGIIEAGGFIVESVEVACESFGIPVVIKVTLEPLKAAEEEDDTETEDEEDTKETASEDSQVVINEEASIEEEASSDETPVEETAAEEKEEETSEEPKEKKSKKS